MSSSIKLENLLDNKEIKKVISDFIEKFSLNIIIENENRIPYLGDENIAETHSFPIVVEENTIGWVRGADGNEILAQLIAYIGAGELEKERTKKEIEYKDDTIKLVRDITEKIATTIDIEKVLSSVLYEIIKGRERSVVSILLLDDSNANLESKVEFYNKSDVTIPVKSSELFLNLESDFVKVLVKNGKIEQENSNFLECIWDEEKIVLHYGISLPIFSKNRVIGYLLVASEKKGICGAEEVQFYNIIALQVGSAIENSKMYSSVKESFFQIVRTLEDIMNVKNAGEKERMQRIINYCLGMAKYLEIPKIEMVKVKLSAMLHDVGNLMISDVILNKEACLTEEEYTIVKSHVELGTNILNNIEQFKEIAPIVRSHHERYDGTGYPNGLKGDRIPLISRIISVADAFEAMTTDREYRENRNLFYVFEELMRKAGTQFDPEVINAFVKTYKGMNLEEIQNQTF